MSHDLATCLHSPESFAHLLVAFSGAWWFVVRAQGVFICKNVGAPHGSTSRTEN